MKWIQYTVIIEIPSFKKKLLNKHIPLANKHLYTTYDFILPIKNPNQKLYFIFHNNHNILMAIYEIILIVIL